MESLNKAFTEEQVNDASTKILKASITKITDEFQGKCRPKTMLLQFKELNLSTY